MQRLQAEQTTQLYSEVYHLASKWLASIELASIEITVHSVRVEALIDIAADLYCVGCTGQLMGLNQAT